MLSEIIESVGVPTLPVAIPALIVLGVCALCAVVIIWRLLSALMSFRTDLVNHQKDDCKRLDELALEQTAHLQLSKGIKEAVDQLDKTVTSKYSELLETHLRHQAKNEDNIKELQEELKKVEIEMASMTGAVPKKRKTKKAS